MTNQSLDFNTYSPGEAGWAELAANPTVPDTITPDSLVFKCVGDPRFGVAALAAGMMQLMYPATGAGVIEHSDFFEDPWSRVFRSAPKIIGSVCSPDAPAIAQWITKRHSKIQGEDDGHGKPYRALDPEVFYDGAHSTFTHTAFRVAKWAGYKLGPPQAEQLYGGTVRWFASYGLDLSPVPRDYESFLAKWHHLCADVFELTPAAKKAIDIAVNREIPKLPSMTDEEWKRLGWPVSEVVSLAALGGVPKDVRERLEVPFSRGDGVKFAALEFALKHGLLNHYLRHYGDFSDVAQPDETAQASSQATA